MFIKEKMRETAIFAAGCFWGVEYAFSKVKGVISATSGYCGGKTKKPTYKEVCTGDTGHAESVRVIFDNKKVTYKDLLKKFWEVHNPTSLNRQGLDFGTQYRSAIFYKSEKQKKEALASKKLAQKKYKKEIVTEIKKAGTFYPAEEYHQKYYEKTGRRVC